MSPKKSNSGQYRAIEASYRSLFDASIDAMIVMTLEEGVVDCNGAAVRMLGLSGREELLGVLPGTFAPTHQPCGTPSSDLIHQYVAETLAQGSNVFEWTLRSKDGREFPTKVVASMAGTGEQAFVLLNVRDMTESKRVEAELRESRRMLRDVINAIPVRVFWKDLDGVYLGCNQLFAEDAGRESPHGVIGDTDHNMGWKEQAELYRSDDRAVIERDEPKVNYEEPQTTPEGEHMWLRTSKIPLKNSRGVTYGVLGTYEDVTTSKKMKEMVIQSEKMMSVGGLAAGMAHEINNPLAGILQSTNVLLNRLSSPDLRANRAAAEEVGVTMDQVARFMEKREVPALLDSLQSAGCRAGEIVSNMLSFARMGEGNFAPHALDVLLDQTVDMARSEYNLQKCYDFKHIEIVREYQGDLPEVSCESGKIQQVFFNLLRNGAEAMFGDCSEGSGSHRFHLGIRHEPVGNMVQVTIRDNGPGMDEETRRRVFEPFFTTKQPDEGTGLGLSVSYFIIVENHGGEMTVDSIPGEGTVFTIGLPVSRGDS